MLIWQQNFNKLSKNDKLDIRISPFALFGYDTGYFSVVMNIHQVSLTNIQFDIKELKFFLLEHFCLSS